MADLLNSAMIWLEGQRHDKLTGSIVYSRDGVSLELSATMGATSYEQQSSDGMLSNIKTKDFIIQKSDFENTFNKPLHGDIISQTVNGTDYVYEVNSPLNEPEFSRDSYELSLRIHTQTVYQFKSTDYMSLLIKTDNAGETANDKFKLTFNGGANNGRINWDDGDFDVLTSNADITHTFPIAGEYSIQMGGSLPRISFNNSGDITKIKEIEQWGIIPWDTMENAFYGCSNMTITATDLPDTSAVSIFTNAFNGCIGLNNSDIPLIDFSNATDGTGCFSGVTLSTESYSNMLIDIESKTTNNDVVFDFGDSLYNIDGAYAKATLYADHNWTISDGGGAGALAGLEIAISEEGILVDGEGNPIVI